MPEMIVVYSVLNLINTIGRRNFQSVHEHMIMKYCMFPTTRTLLADNWYSLSYLYFSPIGTIVVIGVGLLVSLFTGKLCIFDITNIIYILYCLVDYNDFTTCFSGGCRQRAEPRLTFTKEDTTIYHLFKFFKEKVSVADGNGYSMPCVITAAQF